MVQLLDVPAEPSLSRLDTAGGTRRVMRDEQEISKSLARVYPRERGGDVEKARDACKATKVFVGSIVRSHSTRV